jgi:hypothetical protein
MADRNTRRKFPRLDIAEEARIYDENGRELGTIAQVSGNGMSIETTSLPVAQSLQPGQRLRITVLESGSRATNVLDVIIRQREGGKVGMEFVDPVLDTSS